MASYTVEDVEELLSHMFNDSMPGGELAPDGDMPKSYVNPSHLGTNMAEMVDVKRAWRVAPVSAINRIAIELVYGSGLQINEVARVQNRTADAVGREVRKGIESVTHFTNYSKARY